MDGNLALPNSFSEADTKVIDAIDRLCRKKDADQVFIIREKLAELYESEEQLSRAAQMLSGIDLDSNRDDDAVNAEAFINKASFLVSGS
ncbi:hypothetical protein IFM89_034128 [Coptis chinensis]|uniref:Uncharacterized protein n=1 Tax=Coptis chinensis TaxID=261450 RepID=A0A835I7N3_9MAGN|nr:hypothetical protein IFM89_034128 [Coptis chinensis]